MFFCNSRALVALLALSLLGGALSARAEFDVSIYTGVALTPENDLELQQPGGTA